MIQLLTDAPPPERLAYYPHMSLWSKLPEFLFVLAAGSAMCQAPTGQTSLATNAPPNQPLSTRVVAYNIDARVDVKAKTVDATETLTYKNLTGQPLTKFPFHLYLNAFQPDSTFTSETHFGGGIRASDAANDYPAKNIGSIAISHLEADGFGDLTGQLHFVAPDDHNANDKTVAELELSKPVAPGESITFRMSFHDQFPESVARNGYKRDFLMGGQWYPKLGVFWHGAWNCHQYHSTTEFFSDFGTFNVSLTLPKNYTVGASGVLTIDHLNADGTRTLAYYGEDIHDFAWGCQPSLHCNERNLPLVDGASADPRAGARIAPQSRRAIPQHHSGFSQAIRCPLRTVPLQDHHRHRPRTGLRDGRDGVPHAHHRRNIVVRPYLHNRDHRRT